MPVVFLAVYRHDDGAGGGGEGNRGVEDEAAAGARPGSSQADLGDAVGLAVDVEADAHVGGVAVVFTGRNDRVGVFG